MKKGEFTQEGAQAMYEALLAAREFCDVAEATSLVKRIDAALILAGQPVKSNRKATR